MTIESTVTVSAKGQIVRPVLLRKKLDIHTGDKLHVQLVDGHLLLSPAITEQPDWHSWRGTLADSEALHEHLSDHAEEARL